MAIIMFKNVIFTIVFKHDFIILLLLPPSPHQKADRTQLDGKVNQGLFDSTTSDLNKMLQEILDKLSGSVCILTSCSCLLFMPFVHAF